MEILDIVFWLLIIFIRSWKYQNIIKYIKPKIPKKILRYFIVKFNLDTNLNIVARINAIIVNNNVNIPTIVPKFISILKIINE